MILQCSICQQIITSRPITGAPIIGQTDEQTTLAASRSLYPALALHVHTYHAEAVQDTMGAADRFVFLLLLTFCEPTEDRDTLARPLLDLMEKTILAIIGPLHKEGVNDNTPRIVS